MYHETDSVEPRGFRFNQHGQILGRSPTFDHLDDDVLHRFGEVGELRCAVGFGALLNTSYPCVYRSYRIGRGCFAFLPTSIMTGTVPCAASASTVRPSGVISTQVISPGEPKP